MLLLQEKLERLTHFQVKVSKNFSSKLSQFPFKKTKSFFLKLRLENRGEFLEKLQRARAAVRQGIASQPILSTPGTLRIVVGNWVLNSQKEQHLHINNSEGHQVSIDS